MIYTFYSYKGGVGRSMALANVAELFYQSGLRVLVVDWDLEAPGLERFFPIDQKKAVEQKGIMDILLSYKSQMSRNLPINGDRESLPFEKPQSVALEIHPPSPNGGCLHLLTAGKRSSEDFSRYINNVRNFDWQDFYHNWEGELYLDWLREEIEAFADVVLIDSRTGLTELGGICVYHLADAVVILCGASQQNIEGSLRMLRDFTRTEVEQIRGRPLQVLVIPARVEKADSELLNDFQKDFVNTFGGYLLPQGKL
jgi:MinD-like ATPase involved in chromosome partitioning or flagellar assembly